MLRACACLSAAPLFSTSVYDSRWRGGEQRRKGEERKVLRCCPCSLDWAITLQQPSPARPGPIRSTQLCPLSDHPHPQLTRPLAFTDFSFAPDTEPSAAVVTVGATQPSQRHHHEDRAACPMLLAVMQALGKLDCWCFCAVIHQCRGIHPPGPANSCTQDSCQPVNPQAWLSPWVCLGPQCAEAP